MKYSVPLKFIAVALCVLSLTVSAVSGLGVKLLDDSELYYTGQEEAVISYKNNIGLELAWFYTERYSAEVLGDCPEEVLYHQYNYNNRWVSQFGDHFAVDLYQNGVLVSAVNPEIPRLGEPLTYSVSAIYPTVTDITPLRTDAPTEATDPIIIENTYRNEAALDSNTLTAAEDTPLYTDRIQIFTYDEDGTESAALYTLNYYQGPQMDVSVRFPEGSVNTFQMFVIEHLYSWRYAFLIMLTLGLLSFAAGITYLSLVAGRSSSSSVLTPGGLNQIPLDIYLLLGLVLTWLLGRPIRWFMSSIEYFAPFEPQQGSLFLIAVLAMAMVSLLVTGWLFAFAAQFKMGRHYWWNHSILGMALRKLHFGCKAACRGLRGIYCMLPVIGQWLFAAMLMALSVMIPILGLRLTDSPVWHGIWIIVLILAILGSVAIICYGGYCFGLLMQGTRTMAQGDLGHQISLQHLTGIFRDSAEQLNSLAQAAQDAVAVRMKSEHMKTELITNVSHDIKTPLTSIINFVDLMKKPHSEEENRQYLEVLDRQSHRLKKLIDDLMEMSKASTGNMTVELTALDAAEAVNQALGEFADKLEAANLTPVFRYPEEPVVIHADGRLLWRVLSNLLNNAVKYALPGTRLYLDLISLDGSAVISIKNISRDQLNVDAEELMERFVRGDTSRNTEGSGLGLNIAKSLVSLQHGQMDLIVDGDLFKVTLVFPLV